jgi:peptide/nickel transport system permease protein
MIVFVIRRILVSIPVLIASTILTFILVKLSGDPLDYLKTRNPPVPHQVIVSEEHRLGLNHSWPWQYWHWLSNIFFHWNFGPAVHANDNVRNELFHALGVTARLVILVVIISVLLAVVTGVYSAVRQYSITDYTTTFFGFLFLSMPVFWFAILLKEAGIWYNENVSPHTFFTIGDKSVFLTKNDFWSRMSDYFGHLILPTIVLSLASYAGWTRFTRASMLEVLNSDYIRLARSKGLKPRQVLVRHALRTALIPLTTVTALDIATLLGGAVVTEYVFQWHGMGNLFLTAVTNIDFNVMLAWLLVSATIVIAFNLIADILYGILDPRIRHA